MAKLGKGMSFSFEQAFVRRDEIRAPLKTIVQKKAIVHHVIERYIPACEDGIFHGAVCIRRCSSQALLIGETLRAYPLDRISSIKAL